MTENPKAALDAILESDKDVGSINVKPLTLARYALLELVQSPFVARGVPFQPMTIIPTLYIMSVTRDQLKGYTSKTVDNLIADALEWADGVEPDIIEKAVERITEEIERLYRVAPEGTEEEGHQSAGKKAPTAG